VFGRLGARTVLNTEEGQRILALVPEPERASRLRAAFGDKCRVLDSAAELIAASRNERVELVVISALDCHKRPHSTVVAAIRASRRCPPVYVYTDRSTESVRELMPLARAGARGVIIAGVEDDATSLRRLLESGTFDQAVATVTRAALETVKPRYAPLITHCLEHIGDPPTANAFARAMSVSRRTLTAWATSAGVRGVRALTSRCRVLVATEMLRDRRRSVEDVALELQFSSSAHLHNTMKRYTGLRPRAGLSRDTAAWCAALFPAACIHRTPVEESRPPPAEWSITPNGATFFPDQAQPEE
jgi:AraC-like DNA-binding protein